MADLKILSKRLVEVRKSNGYTRKRLAEELNRPYRTITNYETGEHEPGHTYLIEIAKKFGVTADYLLGLSDDPSKTLNNIKSPGAAEATPRENVQKLDVLAAALTQLNEEGQEKLVDYAEDLVASGRYIKSNSDKMGKEKLA